MPPVTTQSLMPPRMIIARAIITFAPGSPRAFPSPLHGGRRGVTVNPKERTMQSCVLTSLTPAPREGGWAVATEGISSDDTVPAVFTGVGLAWI